MSHAPSKNETRTETDAMGSIEVPANRYWGAQTESSIHHFPFDDRMPLPIVHAFGLLKAACAETNCEMGGLSKDLRDLIVSVAKEVSSGKLDEEFPLKVWQTGSGTQSNMNDQIHN